MNEKYGIPSGDEIFENDALLNTSRPKGVPGNLLPFRQIRHGKIPE
jgi:hypothetical protein